MLLLLRVEPAGMVVRPVEGSVGVAVRLVEGCLELGNLVVIRQSGLAAGHLLLWCGQFLGISQQVIESCNIGQAEPRSYLPLIYKIAKEQNMIRKLKSIIKRKQNEREIMT